MGSCNTNETINKQIVYYVSFIMIYVILNVDYMYDFLENFMVLNFVYVGRIVNT